MNDVATEHLATDAVPQSVGVLVARRARSSPDAVAFAGGRIVAAASWQAVEQAAVSMSQLPLVLARHASSRVGLLVEDPVGAAVAFVAALASGITAVPL